MKSYIIIAVSMMLFTGCATVPSQPDKVAINGLEQNDKQIALLSYSCEYISPFKVLLESGDTLLGGLSKPSNITKCKFTVKNISDTNIGKILISVNSYPMFEINTLPAKETITVDGEYRRHLKKPYVIDIKFHNN